MICLFIGIDENQLPQLYTCLCFDGYKYFVEQVNFFSYIHVYALMGINTL